MSWLVQGLTTEAIGMVVEVALVYFLIDYLIKRREREKWRPARRTIVKQLAKTYSSLFGVARHSFEADAYGGFAGRQVFVDKARHDLARLQKTVDLNNAALDSQLMPRVSMFLEEAEALFDKLRYFVLCFSPEHKAHDFVSEPPFIEFQKLEEIVEGLRSDYEDIFTDRKNIHDSVVKADDLVRRWNNLPSYGQKVFFNPAAYRYTNGRIPHVYDLHSLRTLTTAGIPNGQRVQVFNTLT